VTVIGSAGDRKRVCCGVQRQNPATKLPVTNSLGASAGGLKMLQKEPEIRPQIR